MQDEPLDEADLDATRTGQKNINAGSAQSFASAPEDSLSESDRAATGAGDPEAADLAQDDAGFPVNMNITITKPGQQGAMHFGVVAHDGAVAIERVYFFANQKHADAQTADQQWSARNTYTGPPFGNLDEGLQEVLERYLEERGINTSLALWVPEYIEWKEQKEYMNWLEVTKNFVEA
jgi:complement component 1 Q subcomponent-binding protein, mitochondrial